MDLIEHIEKDTLLIIPNSIKYKVLESFNNSKILLNVKIMSLDELKKCYYFDYKSDTKLYLMDKYNLTKDVVRDILSNLYYIEDKDYLSSKLNYLKDIKQDLIDNDYIIYDSYFSMFIKDKNVLVYGYTKIDSFSNKMLKMINAKEINISCEERKNTVNLFSTLDEEVEFVFNKVSKLIDGGVDINDIKFTNVTKEYFYTIRKYSKMFSIPVDLDNESIYSTLMTKEFLSKLSDTQSFDESLNYLKDAFDITKERNSIIYKALFNISNKYYDLDYTFDNIYDLVKNDIKEYSFVLNNYDKKIELISLEDNIFDDSYVFLFNFNQGEIPKTYKDEDYISDYEKQNDGLDLETSYEKNILSKASVIESINRIKNLVITAKENSIQNDYIVSNLASELNYDVVRGKVNNKISYSSINSKIKLTKYLDNFIKYGTIYEDLSLLYSNYNISYSTYSNKFTGVDRDTLLKSFNNKLTLSYSSLDNYFHCAFRYYISNILKIDKFEENFNTTLGTLFHYILSVCFKDDFDYSNEYDNYVKTLTLTEKERFFIDKLKDELEFVIIQVQKLHKETGLNKLLLEHKIKIDKTTVIPVDFVGIVDKIMYKEKENTLVSIIDYKTGNPSIDLYNVIYGLSMQLPIYLYLVEKSKLFKNVRFTGFYLQKILSKGINFSTTKNYSTQKEDLLKLEGYSNSDPSILEVFMPDYENSKFIKSMKTTSKGFSSYSKVLSDIEISNLVDVVDKKIDEARDNILDGNFNINPKQIGDDKVGCEFCRFKDLCFKTNNDYIKLVENKSLSFLGGDYNA